MAVREIITFPEHKEALRKISEPVIQLDQKTRRLIRDLKDTLRASSDGVGLAAPQINIHQRVVIVCVNLEAKGKWKPGLPQALINPVILSEDDLQKDFDGCLSFPGLYGETRRPHRLRIKNLNEMGSPVETLYEGFNAVVVHHEIDHLDGILFIDRIENLSDLYRIHENENGEMIKTPLKEGASWF